MTIREFYECTGGNYEEVLARFLSEERTARFLHMFPKDPSFDGVEAVFPEKAEEPFEEVSEAVLREAFRAAHTLKGVCLNLGFKRLYASASAVTEALREADVRQTLALMPALRRDYREVMEALRQIG